MSQFDDLGDAYERSPELAYREHAEKYSMRQSIGDVAGLAVLDLGCGTGLYTRRLAQWGAARVVGIDVSEGMLATARAEEHEDPLNVEYLQRDAAHPGPNGDPALDGQFDLVSSVYVLCYAATQGELAGFFTTARRSLSPAGRRLVAMTLDTEYSREPEYYSRYGLALTPTEEGEGRPVVLDVSTPGGKIHVTLYWWSRNTYADCAAQAGFTDISWSKVTVSEQGLAQFGRDFWEPWLTAPPVAILTATV
jgi:SAM-dependent methyltransferase